MKRLLLLAFFAMAIINTNAQEISEEQWSLVTKKTADWCTFCGGWGWTFNNFLFQDHSDKPVVIWAAHYSGGLKTPTSEAIMENFPSSGQPVFYINNDNMNVGSGNMNAKRGEFEEFLDGLSGFEAFGGVGSSATFDGEKITNTAKVKFFVDLEGGSYWLASYLVDDILVAPQTSQGNNAQHKNVLLHSFNGENYFGMNIRNGAVLKDQEFTVEGMLDFSNLPVIPDYSDGYSVVTILWTKVDGTFTPFNLNSQPITSVVSVKEVLNNVDIVGFHSGADLIDLNITSASDLQNVDISLFDINGQLVTSKNNLNIHTGENKILLNAKELALGTYIVLIQSKIGSKSIKISIL